ncbi:MAG: hypothetical protein V1685_05395 [Parcubacteria group bacterium]
MTVTSIQKRHAYSAILGLILDEIDRWRTRVPPVTQDDEFLDVLLCPVDPFQVELRIADSLLIVEGLPDELAQTIPTVEDIQDEHPSFNPHAVLHLTIGQFADRVVDWLASAEPHHSVFSVPTN